LDAEFSRNIQKQLQIESGFKKNTDQTKQKEKKTEKKM